jgi:RNA polymerase sigma-70 factor, ECF subfamily
MVGSTAADAVLPSPCAACGGEIVLSVTGRPSLLEQRCARCGEGKTEAFAPSRTAQGFLDHVIRERERQRAHLSLPRPVILLWLPPGEDLHVEYRDARILIDARLAANDPSVWLRTEPYPPSPEDESAALAALADLSLLVAPGAAACRRAVSLLGEAIPASRALVLATGIDDDEAVALEHPRLRVLSRRPDEPGGLFDLLADALVRIRRVAWWRVLDSTSPPGNPLTIHESHAPAVATVVDDLCTYLLHLTNQAPPHLPERLLAEAGGAAVFAPRLQVLREAGMVDIVRQRAQVTNRGRALLGKLLPDTETQKVRRPSTLARLFEEARTGNQDSLGRLLKTGGEQARMVARRRLGPALRAKVDSIDISQSVVVELMRGIESFEYRSDPAWRGYLRRLVENKIRAKADYFGAARRDMKRERSIETRGRAEDDRGTEPPARCPSPSEMLLREEEIGNLEKALEQMTPAERDVIILRVFEGISHREIARRLGRPSENSVHKLYGRALAKLAGLLGRPL